MRRTITHKDYLCEITYMVRAMDLPDLNGFLPWITGIGGAAAGSVVGARKWWFKDRQAIRQDAQEGTIGGAYDDVIAVMRQQIRDSTKDRWDIWAKLQQCEKQHAECRNETHTLREQTEGLRIRIDELEKMP
jgi:hypothetical protein